MIGKLALAKQSSDLSSSLFTQAVALELLESGFDREHSRSINELYRQRPDLPSQEAAAATGAPVGISRTFQNLALFRNMSVIDNVRVGAHTASRGDFGR